MSSIFKCSEVETLIRLALEEDIGFGDITSQAIFDKNAISHARIISKDTGVLCGTEIVACVYKVVDPSVKVTGTMKDGMNIHPDDEVLKITGPTIGLLSGERIALNFIQHMSGIASRTAQIASLLKGTQITLLDTRKTLPGFRKIDKYAVKTGGGTNHRMGLYDMVMIKDNHIQAAGSIAKAVNTTRNAYGSRYTIEVETATLDEVQEAVSASIDIIMLDNMDTTMIKKAISIINKQAKIEVSGNMDENRIKELINLDIDFVSMGSITHSVKAFDLSMEFINLANNKGDS